MRRCRCNGGQASRGLRLRAAARTHLESYYLGNCTFGKLPLEKLHIWEIAP